MPLIRRQDWEAALNPAPYPQPTCTGNWQVGITAGPGGSYHSGWPYGPRVAPPWGYPGLGGGPYVGYPWGWPGYSARAGQNWSNGLSLYGPPVPVYGPIPGVMGNSDLNHQWHDVPSMGIGYGWFGVYAASPRPRQLSVSVWPSIEGVPSPTAPAAPSPEAAAPGGSALLILSVRVPQPAAEVFVNGVKTTQTGTDRTFESPPLDAGKQYKYELTARLGRGRRDAGSEEGRHRDAGRGGARGFYDAIEASNCLKVLNPCPQPTNDLNTASQERARGCQMRHPLL